MVTTDLLYRKFSSADFVPFEAESRILPVRLKNDYVKQDEYFDFEKNKWLPLSVCKPGMGYSEEFVEFPYKTEQYLKNSAEDIFYADIEKEDFSADEMAKVLIYRNYKNRMKFNRENFYDSRKIKKDFIKAKITTDMENLLLKITFTEFSRGKNEQPHYETEIPRLEEKSLVFDMKNASANFDDFTKDSLADNKNFCSELDDILPYEAIEKSYERLLELAEAFTGVSFEFFRREMKGRRIKMHEFYTLTMLPFCPKLYDILNNKEIQERKIRFHAKRNDSKIFNHFCRKYKIKNTKTLRKVFAERPGVLITFLRLKDAGFSDINLYNYVIKSKEKSEIIDNVDSKSLEFFCRYSIKKRGQKATMNTIFRGTEHIRYDFVNLYDSLKMFEKYFRHLPDTLKNDIMTDGFTEFNHNALSSLAYRYENKNIVFSYTDEEKNLEDEIKGYSFRLPKDSYQLCEIGSALHNCVASYSERIKNKECLIVYVTKDDEYKICVEVRGKETFQERIDRNYIPTIDQRILLARWRGKHGLRFRFG